jgi:hypothetical protein
MLPEFGRRASAISKSEAGLRDDAAIASFTAGGKSESVISTGVVNGGV